MRRVGQRVLASSSDTACRDSPTYRSRTSLQPLSDKHAPNTATGPEFCIPDAIARWKRLGRSTTKKRMAVVLGRQDGARRRRDMPGGRCHGTRATPQRRGHGLCGRHRCKEAARRESHPHHHGQKGQSCPNGHTGTTGVGRDGAGACTRQPTARERASGGLAGSSRHGLLGFTATTGTFHAGAPEMKVRDYCAATLVGQRVFLGFSGDEAAVSPRTGDAAAEYGSWPWRPLRCGFPRPAWQTPVPGAF